MKLNSSIFCNRKIIFVEQRILGCKIIPIPKWDQLGSMQIAVELRTLPERNIWFMMTLACLDQLEVHWAFFLDSPLWTLSAWLWISYWEKSTKRSFLKMTQKLPPKLLLKLLFNSEYLFMKKWGRYGPKIDVVNIHFFHTSMLFLILGVQK